MAKMSCAFWPPAGAAAGLATGAVAAGASSSSNELAAGAALGAGATGAGAASSSTTGADVDEADGAAMPAGLKY